MPAEWMCPTCGAPVQDGLDVCPFCRTTAKGEVQPSSFAVAAGYVGHALVVCLGWTTFFALCGLIAAWAKGDWDFLKVITVLGLIVGTLFGLGDIVIRAVRSRLEPVEEEPNPAGDAAVLSGHVLGALVPALKPFILLGMALGWVAGKDFKRQAPGRGRRALVGAMVLGLLGTGLLTTVYLVAGPPPAGGMTMWEATAIILILSGIGAVLGLLSDAW